MAFEFEHLRFNVVRVIYQGLNDHYDVTVSV